MNTKNEINLKKQMLLLHEKWRETYPYYYDQAGKLKGELK